MRLLAVSSGIEMWRPAKQIVGVFLGATVLTHLSRRDSV